MAASSRHTGWRHDENNSRLDMYYRGTRVGHIDGCNLQVLGNVVSCGTTYFGGNCASLTAACSTLNVCSGGDVVFWNAAGLKFTSCMQFLNTGGCDMFLAASCAEPCSAAKGVVWAWQGDACATAPCGSAFLMITDDGCV